MVEGQVNTYPSVERYAVGDQVLVGRPEMQLHYIPLPTASNCIRTGSPGPDRTDDHRFNKAPLLPLSYRGLFGT